MNDLDQKILEMKPWRSQSRKIAQTVRISHESVRKKLLDLEGVNDQVSTNPEDHLTASVIENERVSTDSNACKSRASEESESVVNLIPSVETPSLSPTTGVNPLETLADKLPRCKKRGISGGRSR